MTSLPLVVPEPYNLLPLVMGKGNHAVVNTVVRRNINPVSWCTAILASGWGVARCTHPKQKCNDRYHSAPARQLPQSSRPGYCAGCTCGDAKARRSATAAPPRQQPLRNIPTRQPSRRLTRQCAWGLRRILFAHAQRPGLGLGRHGGKFGCTRITLGLRRGTLQTCAKSCAELRKANRAPSHGSKFVRQATRPAHAHREVDAVHHVYVVGRVARAKRCAL